MNSGKNKRIFGTRHYNRFSEAVEKLDISDENKLELVAVCCTVFKQDNPEFDHKVFLTKSGLVKKKE